LVSLRHERVQNLEGRTCPGLVVRGRKPASVQQLFFWHSSSQAPLAVAHVNRHLVDAVGMEHHKICVKRDGLKTALPRSVSQLDAQTKTFEA
jgi:hypothetical protein